MRAPHPPSREMFYTGSGLDRVSDRRGDAAWVAARLADPENRMLPVWRSQNGFVADADGAAAPESLLLEPSECAPLIAAGAQTVLLGLTAAGAARFALDLSHLDSPETMPVLAGRGAFADLRVFGPLLPRAEGAMLAHARAMLTWHHRHLFCGRCGAATESRAAGHERRCTDAECSLPQFPRTDPAVIMLVAREDACLLGRQAAWPAGMYSTLAGFVEPGEALEEAVAREVFEEVGVRVAGARYFASQPWPFPTSLMLGFFATTAETEITVATNELEDARWFTRDFLRALPEDGRFRLPRADSIARRLIETWLAENR